MDFEGAFVVEKPMTALTPALAANPIFGRVMAPRRAPIACIKSEYRIEAFFLDLAAAEGENVASSDVHCVFSTGGEAARFFRGEFFPCEFVGCEN